MIIFDDLNRYSDTLLTKIKILLVSPSFHSVIIYRLSVFFMKNIPFIGNIFAIFLEYINRVLYSVEISRYSTIDKGLIIVHGMGIVIGDNVSIGKNCKILNGVNLGNKDTEIDTNHQPIIGDNVVIGAGAKCLGNIKIGNNVKIGANSVVLDDIPDNCIAVGVPAKIIKG